MIVPVSDFCTISVLPIFLFGEVRGRRNRNWIVRLETRILQQRDAAEQIEIYSKLGIVAFTLCSPQTPGATITKDIKIKFFIDIITKF